MTRWLVILAIVVVAAFIAVIVWPRDNGNRPSAAVVTSGAPGEAVRPAGFTVLIDGEEIQVADPVLGTRMADLPVSSWNSSMVSNIRSIGTTQILVFVDGSEVVVDSFIRSRMPEDIAYRAGYSRE